MRERETLQMRNAQTQNPAEAGRGNVSGCPQRTFGHNSTSGTMTTAVVCAGRRFRDRAARFYDLNAPSSTARDQILTKVGL